MEQHIYEITELNNYIKSLLDGDRALSGLYVRGELSNYKMYPSGHHYFTLKDQEGALKCVMFRAQASRLRFKPENGMKVIALGRVTVFPRDGAYQLYCDALAPEGMGDLHAAFEQLKEKLRREGLFDQSRKKPLPPYPERVAIITSEAGAAIRDILEMLGRRWPLCTAVLLPVRVQGAEAPGEIAGAIRYANRWRVADLIITGRGGGSLEELWAFNEEVVARAIYESELPVISAVGHETDVTISDFAADVRALTPTHAGGMVGPDRLELASRLRSIQAQLGREAAGRLQRLRQRLSASAGKRVLTDPLAFVADKRVLTDHLQRHLAARGEALLSGAQGRLGVLAAALDAMSPLKVLGRGYALAAGEDGVPLRSVADRKAGDPVAVTLTDGVLGCRVETVTAAGTAKEKRP